MNAAADREKGETSRSIRTASDELLLQARAVTVSRGYSIGQFAVFADTGAERIQISNDLSFRSANELKERHLQRRFFLTRELPALKRL
jgi:hypothetical protein